MKFDFLFKCTTSAVKGPIAILDPAIENLPPRMCVFETLHDKYDARPMLVHHGVSLLLLDYLLVTALFLVTDVQDWMLVKKFEGQVIDVPPSQGEDVSSLRSAASSLQLRKIMLGEPLYPKQSSLSSMSSLDVTPPTPTSSEQMAKIVYGDPLYPTLSLRSSSSDISSSESDKEPDSVFFSSSPTGLPSPSGESIYPPSTASTPPSHTYFDPSFYNDHDIPPVPRIPAQYDTPGAGPSRGSTSRPSSSHSTTSSMRQLRELPMPPIPALVPRPRSTPPRSMTSPGTSGERAAISPGHHSLPTPQRLPEPSTSRPTGRPRQLPRLPSSSQSDGYNPHSQTTILGRARSQSVRSSKRSSQWPRTLPAPPIGSSTSGNDTQNHSPSRRALKEAEDDLSSWVHSLTHPREFPHVPLPQATFDVPPPAYNSINFQTAVDLPVTPSLPPPIPQSLSLSPGA